ncbi:MAG: Flp pilus assembly complex ATPase component TadA, partial [Phycisphaerales bacterium]|nr:Flp pilus assembly complex ATPase component TadA [Phycisphaerales bacterium]
MTSAVTLEHEAQPRQTNTVVVSAHGSPPALDASPAITPPPPCHHTLALLTHTFARTHLLLPVRDQQGTLSALVAATDAAAPHHASHAEGLHTLMAVLRLAGHASDAESLVRPDATIPVDAEALAQQIDNAFATQPDAHDRAPCGPGAPDDAEMPDIHAHGSGDMLPDLDTALADARRAADADVLTLEGKSPIVRLVDAMLFAAITQGASDIHIQPLPDIALIRYRIDGVLITARRIPAALAAAVTSRIKIMSRLDVAETRAPQDGRAAVTLGPAQRRRSIDLRISIIPSATGQRVVIRLLDTQRGTRLANIESLAMPTDVQTTFLDRAARVSGIILATGPTGSGKTTTLYAALRWIATRTALGARTSSQAGASLETPSTVNILTIEDPIEYDLSAPHSAAGARLPISQTQVDPFKNVTFASGLRHVLRQDPDVIMVGEIRD